MAREIVKREDHKYSTPKRIYKLYETVAQTVEDSTPKGFVTKISKSKKVAKIIRGELAKDHFNLPQIEGIQDICRSQAMDNQQKDNALEEILSAL